MNDSPDKRPESVAPTRDWLALLSQAEVVGPLSDDELRACLADGQIPQSARLFRFQPDLDTGDRAAALAADNIRLADSLRAAEAEARRLEADVKARDMEFEGERQQMAADVSKLRAESLRKDAQIETLEKNTALLAEAKTARADAERKLRECELNAARLSAAATEAEAVRAEVASLRQRAEALQKALDAARARLRDQTARLSEVAGTLSALAAESSAAEADSTEPAIPPQNPSPSLPSDRKTAVRPFPAERPAAEVIEPIVERPSPSSDAVKASPKTPPHAADSRLAQLEARAREELAKLGERGGATPRWARRKP